MAQITINVPSGKNWKTTLCGAIAGIGAYMAATPEPPVVPIIGKALVIAGPILLGFFSKDSNVTGGSVSQDVGEIMGKMIDRAEQCAPPTKQ